MPIKVLIIDDSALVRKMLSEILESDPRIDVVGTAADPYIARRKIKKLNPDVLTLDVEMPRMDGITFLENLMRLRPMPVVMVSSLTERGVAVTLRALELGAIDCIPKPKLDIASGLQEYAEEILEKVKVAAEARVRTLDERDRICKETRKKYTVDDVYKKCSEKRHPELKEKIIGLGASTGGTEAIADLLQYLPADMPGIVITQHIPKTFSRQFAERLHARSELTVAEAEDGQQITRGHAYVAPGDKHLTVERDGPNYVCRLNDGPLVNRHKPAVDVMFRSLAQNVGPNSIGLIMTGMGSDGAIGLGEMQGSGAFTLAQDEKSSVVWGMPGEAVKLGVVNEVISLQLIAKRLMELSV